MIEVKLKQLMAQHDYTITKLSEESGLHRNTISNLMNGKSNRVDFEVLNKLCEVFNCDTCGIISYTKDK